MSSSCNVCNYYDVADFIGQLSVCEPCRDALVGFPMSNTDRTNAVPLQPSDESELRRMFPLIPAETKLFAVVPQRRSTLQPAAVDEKNLNIYFQAADVTARPPIVEKLVTQKSERAIKWFRRTVLKRLSFARNATLFKDVVHVTETSGVDNKQYTVLSFETGRKTAADMLATLRGHLIAIRYHLYSLKSLDPAPTTVSNGLSALRADLEHARYAWRSADRYPLRSSVKFAVGLQEVINKLDILIAWETTRFHEQMQHRDRIGVTACGKWIAVLLRNIHDMSQKFLSAEAVLLVFLHEVAHNISPVVNVVRGTRHVQDGHGPSFYAAYQMLFIVAIYA